MKETVRLIASTLPFRAAVAFFILWGHIAAMEKLSVDRFATPWQSPQAFGEPRFLDPAHDTVPLAWNRLVVSRWDAQHYVELGLRGYAPCKTKAELAPGEFPDDDKRCQLSFFPTYGLLGRWVAHALHWSIDYALLAVSLVSSFLFIMMWTSSVVTDSLGVGTTYLALLLFNVFTSGFALVTVQTEPLFFMLMMATYYFFAHRWFFAAAIAAGGATAVRITGVPIGFALTIGMIVYTLRERPPLSTWIVRTFYAALSIWGICALMYYYRERFGDALIYAHAHGRQYHHEASIWPILHPDTRMLMQSIWAEPNDGLWLAAGLLWFTIAHRAGLERFDVSAQAFWYALFLGVVGVATIGSSEYAYGGLTRYMLGAIPLFFAMAAFMRRRPVLLALWLYISVAHYWGGSMCFYVSHNRADRFEKCGFARHFTSDL